METLIKPLNIKKKLVFSRLGDILIVDEGDNFSGLFDISSIGGTLTFDLPAMENVAYVTEEKPELNVANLKKFDYVFLYYAEVESDREPKDEEWKQIFGGYIESIKLMTTKTSQVYSVTCNSMLALSAYSYFPRPLVSIKLGEMPKMILQLSGLQIGKYNDRNIVSKDIIPEEYMDIQVSEIFGDISVSNIQETNAKDALISLRDKYGLILTENMDGMVQVTSLTNYLSSVNMYKYKVNVDKSSIGDRVLGWAAGAFAGITGLTFLSPEFMQRSQKRSAGIVAILSVVDIILDVVMTMVGAPETQQLNMKVTLRGEYEKKIEENEIARTYGLYSDLMDTEYIVDDILVFDVNKNVFEVNYPDAACQYNGVLVYGLFQIGKAVDIVDVIMRDIPVDSNGKMNLNMLKLYRRDINSEPELNKIAREKLLEIKQEQRIKIKTRFMPFYRVGMPFIFKDGNRYKGDEIFFISRIAYTLSKDRVDCILEGFTSVLNTLPKSAIIDNSVVSDVRAMELYDKIPDDTWQNF